MHLALACKCPVPGLLDPLHHRACYLVQIFSNLFKTYYFVKIRLMLSKFVFLPIFVLFFNICLIFLNICQYFIFICQNSSLFVNSLSKSVFTRLHLSLCVFICFFVFICLYLSKFAWAASKPYLILSPFNLGRRNRSMICYFRSQKVTTESFC